jgi:hypothetical protein
LNNSRRHVQRRKKRTRERGALWTVRDADRIREKVRDAVERRCGGSQRRAALEYGLSQSWLSKFLRGGKLIAAEWDTLYGLMNLIGDDQSGGWPEFIMPSGAAHTIGPASTQWVSEFLANASHGTGQRWIRAGEDFVRVPIERDNAGLSARDRERATLWRHIKMKWPKLAARFDKLFRDDLKGLDRVALVRILDPLIDDSESGYFFRSWREFHPKHLEAIVKLGILREEKLLTPFVHPVERLIRASDTPVSQFERDHGRESVWPDHRHPHS